MIPETVLFIPPSLTSEAIFGTVFIIISQETIVVCEHIKLGLGHG